MNGPQNTKEEEGRNAKKTTTTTKGHGQTNKSTDLSVLRFSESDKKNYSLSFDPNSSKSFISFEI